jgi:hypothetical protein
MMVHGVPEIMEKLQKFVCLDFCPFLWSSPLKGMGNSGVGEYIHEGDIS